MKRWANEEGAASRIHHGGAAGGGSGGGRGSGMRTGTGMGMGVAAGAAVTGHNRPRGSATTAAGKPPVKKPTNTTGTGSGTGTTATGTAPVRRTVSALSAVADRRGRFGA
jgi:hypothetical protein